VSEAVRFHLDEHMPRALARTLRGKGVDVTTTPEAHLMQADDERVTRLRETRRPCQRDRRRRLPAPAVERFDYAGVAYCDRTSLTLRQIIDGLLFIHGVLAAEEMLGHVEYL
jgi:hypothetical protein